MNVEEWIEFLKDVPKDHEVNILDPSDQELVYDVIACEKSVTVWPHYTY